MPSSLHLLCGSWKGVKEGGGEYELMRCCREEQHTNIVWAGQKGEKDSEKAPNRGPTDFQGENADNRKERRSSPEKRDINRGRKIVWVTVRGVNHWRWDANSSQERKNEMGGGVLQEVKDRQAKPPLTWVWEIVSNTRWRAHSLPFGGSRLKACCQCLIKSSLGLQPAVAMRKCNFLHGLPLVNLQAATLINTIQTNVSQHFHANINHSDISFLTSVSPLARSLARSKTLREVERGRRRGGKKKSKMEEKRATSACQKQETRCLL